MRPSCSAPARETAVETAGQRQTPTRMAIRKTIGHQARCATLSFPNTIPSSTATCVTGPKSPPPTWPRQSSTITSPPTPRSSGPRIFRSPSCRTLPGARSGWTTSPAPNSRSRARSSRATLSRACPLAPTATTSGHGNPRITRTGRPTRPDSATAATWTTTGPSPTRKKATRPRPSS